MAVTIAYRKLDASGDPIFGNGQANFLTDLEAVAQAILTRLKLLQGEWWESTSLGTPLFQSMLGVAGAGKQPDVITLIVQQRILGTPYVLEVQNVSGSYDPATRAFAFSCSVVTLFGTFVLASAPASSASLVNN